MSGGNDEVVHPPVVERIRIAVRERPVADEELSQIQLSLRTDEEKLVAFEPIAAEGLMYDYDYYYPSSSRQRDLFQTIGLEMVDVVLGGLSANCVAFGNADTGKTHTLFGSENESGLIQDTVRELFTRLEAQSDQFEYSISLRYWEMSCNGVLDNLGDDDYEQLNGTATGRGVSDAKVPHSVFRDGFGRLYVANLTEVDLGGYDEFEFFLNVGHSRRIQRGKERHSRWHGFVQICVTTTDRACGEKCVLRQMTFVHMKGPDQAGAKGARGAWLRECSTINVSVTLLCAGIIHSLEYRNKRMAATRKAATGSNGSQDALHQLILKSESFFMECKFSQIMAQFLCGHEASFVIGCVNPLNFHESVDTLENLQLLHQLLCACVPVITSSEKGLLMRKLRKLERAFGEAEVLESVYNDNSGRPMTEEEETLRQLRGKVENWGRGDAAAAAGPEDDADAMKNRTKEVQRHEEELKQRSRVRLAGDAAAGRQRDRSSTGKGAQTTAVTHGDRKKIYLNAAKTATYEGQWADGLFDGFGEHIQSNFKYRGEFRGGQREGEGTLFLRHSKGEPYRRVYQGEWLAGKRDGRGTQWADDGEVYEGDFAGDQRHGNGKLYSTNGDIVEGSFRFDRIEGWAVLVTAGGDWFEGCWSQGMREGPGVWHFVKRQQCLKGEWSKNVSVMGVFEDDDEKSDDRNSGFIPRVAVKNYEDILVKQRAKLNERRTRDFAAQGLTWVDHALAAVDGDIDGDAE